MMVSNPCTHCKNSDICKYVIADNAVVLNNLRTSFNDDSPFSIMVECKHRAVRNYNVQLSSEIKNISMAGDGI